MFKKPDKPVYVTRPAMPPIEEFEEYIKKIWASKHLTNHGPFHQQLERELANYLGVKHVSVFVNGTIALITALQAARITGEVITTPFSFVATTHSLWWNNIKPVFVDIEPGHFTLDPAKIEAAITPQTTAILPVHVYGNPCNVEAIQKIADTYGLKVIYDAAHTFGVRVNGKSVLNYGDLSILSFHATKVFNTFEGGAIISHDEKTWRRIYFLRNFGFADEETVIGPGINAKMNELQSAFGLIQLKYIDEYIRKQKTITEIYRAGLDGIKGLSYFSDISDTGQTWSYFPVLIDAKQYGLTRDEVNNMLKTHNIFARRYFYPLISQFPTYRSLPSSKPENLPVATKVAAEILCLPIYPDLEHDYVYFIIDLLKNGPR